MALLAEKEFLRENIGKGVFLFFGDLGFRMGARKCESDKPGCLVSCSLMVTLGTNITLLTVSTHIPFPGLHDSQLSLILQDDPRGRGTPHLTADSWWVPVSENFQEPVYPHLWLLDIEETQASVCRVQTTVEWGSHFLHGALWVDGIIYTDSAGTLA